MKRVKRKHSPCYLKACHANFIINNNTMLVMIVTRDVVYNKATDDFTVSVKDLKRDIVMDGER